jgi:hypothetical protein
MKIVDLSIVVSLQHHGVGQPGSYWEISDGSEKFRLLTAEAQDLAGRIDEHGERVVDDLTLEEECTTMGGERILLRLTGAAAKALSAAVNSSK